MPRPVYMVFVITTKLKIQNLGFSIAQSITQLLPRNNFPINCVYHN